MTVLATGFSTDYFISEQEYRGARAVADDSVPSLGLATDVGRVWGGKSDPSGGKNDRSYSNNAAEEQPRGFFISRWLYRLFGRRGRS
jgi:hypothetical protein